MFVSRVEYIQAFLDLRWSEKKTQKQNPLKSSLLSSLKGRKIG